MLSRKLSPTPVLALVLLASASFAEEDRVRTLEGALHQVLSAPDFGEARDRLGAVVQDLDSFAIRDEWELGDFMDELEEHFAPARAELQTLGGHYETLLTHFLERIDKMEVNQPLLIWLAKTRPATDFLPAFEKLAGRLRLEWVYQGPDTDDLDLRGGDVIRALAQGEASPTVLREVTRVMMMENALSRGGGGSELADLGTAYDLTGALRPAVRVHAVRDCLYLVDILPGGYNGALPRSGEALLLDWVDLAYAQLEREVAYGLVFDLISRIGRTPEASGPWSSLSPEFWEDLREHVALDHTIRLMEGFIPFTDFDADVSEDLARSKGRKILQRLRGRQAGADDLEKVASWIDARIDRELRHEVEARDPIPPFVRFFASCRVGGAITGEAVEGSHDLRKGDAGDPTFRLLKYIDGHWTEIARIGAGGGKIAWFRWNRLLQLKQWLGLVE